MDKKYDFYIASGWFNADQKDDLDIIESIMFKYSANVFLPREQTSCPPTASNSEREIAFNKNLYGIDNSNCIIVNTRSKDMGSIFEAGYAFSKGIPIIYFYRGGDLDGFNLMLAQSGHYVTLSTEELNYAIKDYFASNKILKRLEYEGNIE